MNSVIIQYKGIDITWSNFGMLLWLVPIELLLGAIAVTVVWSWFIVPLGVPSIGIAHAIGLRLVVRVFIGYPETPDTDGINTSRGLVIHYLSHAIARYGFLLLWAWIVTWFM